MKRWKTIWTIVAVLIALSATSCHQVKRQLTRHSNADSLVLAVKSSGTPEELIAVVDSLEKQGDLNSVKANSMRGYAYYLLEKDRMAEMYFRKAMDEYKHQDEATARMYIVNMSAFSRLLLLKGKYEDGIKVCTQLLQANSDDPEKNPMSYRIRSNLLSDLAIFNANLGRYEEADRIFKQAYAYAEQELGKDSAAPYNLALISADARIVYNNHDQLKLLEEWCHREEGAIQLWAKTDEAKNNPIELDRMYGKLYRSLMELYQKQDKKKETAEAYRKFMRTKYAHSLGGKVQSIIFLQNEKRSDEAAALCPYVDTLLAKSGKRITFEEIRGYLKVKYKVLRQANHQSEALHSADQICDAFDSALVWHKQDATAELATIYETQEKEHTIHEQQATLSQQRWIGTLVAVGLLVIFFTVYTLYRRKATKRLAIAHEELKTAYDQLEETTTAKERIESELRIARDIQMSMVPNIFPDREGLDLFASMHPAKEVGGDLYGYLLQGDELYFCVGDVSGKGVPASLFMAQAIRLFMALAKQHMMPAEMATRLNAELSENNDNGMFVTMFIGKVHLANGHLDFCNAGHNPPVIGGDDKHGSFLEMEPNAPIGLWPEMEYIGEEIECIFGRPLFLYTDGLNEAENPQQKQFGDERLLDILQHTHFENARQVIETLENQVHSFREGADPNDDLTMMCLRVSRPTH